MKQILILFSGLFIFTNWSCKKSSDYEIIPAEKYLKEQVTPEFFNRLDKQDKKNDFKFLRNFKNEKLKVQKDLLDELESAVSDTSGIQALSQRADKLTELLKQFNNKNEKIAVENNVFYSSLELRMRYNRNDSATKTYAEINGKIDNIKNNVRRIREDYKIYKIIQYNLGIVEKDINACDRQIDKTLNPDAYEQEFRQIISISFSVLIGLLLIIFFTVVYMGNAGNENLAKDLLSGNGLQFMTLFILIIAIILFGILDIFLSSELAALLSGISGYILGKGTIKDLGRFLKK